MSPRYKLRTRYYEPIPSGATDLLDPERVAVLLPLHRRHRRVGVHRAADDARQLPRDVYDRGHVDHSGGVWIEGERSEQEIQTSV